MSRSKKETTEFTKAFTTALQNGDHEALMALIDPSKYKDGSVSQVHRCRYLNHWKRVAALLTFQTNNTKGKSEEFQRLFTELCRRFLGSQKAVAQRGDTIVQLHQKLSAKGRDNREMADALIIERDKSEQLSIQLEKAMERVRGTNAIGDAIIQAGWADSAQEIESVSRTAVALIWKYRTTLQQLGEMREKYESACQDIAAIHAAAMGEVCAPVNGVIEDVEELRRKALDQADCINVVLDYFGVSHISKSATGEVMIAFKPGVKPILKQEETVQ